MIVNKSLSIADLEAYDERPSTCGSERRFLCPYCGDGHPRDAAHRSLSANTQTGAYKCHRCDARGKLTEWWQDRPNTTTTRATARQQRLRRAFAVPPVTATTQDEGAADWRTRFGDIVGLASEQAQAGAEYLSRRGIAVEVASLSRVSFCRWWYGEPAIVFPLYDEAGRLIAAQGRAIFGDAKKIAGPKSNGTFAAHSLTDGGEVINALRPEATRKSKPLIITEAPIDALTLAACGFPAIALCGTSAPAWLHRACGLRRVVLATDDDTAGDNAAATLAATLEPFGAKCERWKPFGAKDWNEALQQRGPMALNALLRLRNYERLTHTGKKSAAWLLRLHRWAERCTGQRLDLTGEPIVTPPPFYAGDAFISEVSDTRSAREYADSEPSLTPEQRDYLRACIDAAELTPPGQPLIAPGTTY